MKIAKPTELDLQALEQLFRLIDSVEAGHWPLPEATDETINVEHEDAPFAEEEFDDLKSFHDRVMYLATNPPSGIARCIMSFLVLSDPRNRIIDHNSDALTTHPRIDKAEKAVLHIVGRLKADPCLAYLMGEGTQAWNELTDAAATILNKPVESYRQELWSTLKTQPVCWNCEQG